MTTKWTKAHETELNRLLALRDANRTIAMFDNSEGELMHHADGSIMLFTEEEYVKDHEGTEDVPVTFKRHKNAEKYTIECPVYYSSEGVFEMTITQPLHRALRTFAAALKRDTVEEGL